MSNSSLSNGRKYRIGIFKNNGDVPYLLANVSIENNLCFRIFTFELSIGVL